MSACPHCDSSPCQCAAIVAAEADAAVDAYLGDGLYVAHDQWQVEVYAHNGIGKTDRVFLDPTVLTNFLRYLKDKEIFPDV